MWYTWSVVALALCWKLAESDVTVTISDVCGLITLVI